MNSSDTKVATCSIRTQVAPSLGPDPMLHPRLLSKVFILFLLPAPLSFPAQFKCPIFEADRSRGVVGTGRAPAGEGIPVLTLTLFAARGGGRVRFRGQRSPPTHFSPPRLGAWGSGAQAGAAARSPELHQPDGGRVRPHAPGIFSPPSGPRALQGPGVRAA